MVDCLTLMLNMDIFGAAMCPFTNIPTFGPWFFAIVILAIEAALYFKTDDIMTPTIVGMAISGASLASSSLISLPAEFFTAATLLFALNFAIVFFKVYRGR